MGKRYKAGDVVGELTLLSKLDSKHWSVRCSCGSELAVPVEYLSKGRTGCYCNKKYKVDKDVIYDMYIKRRMTIEAIAKEAGIAISTVCRYLDIYMINRDDRYLYTTDEDVIEKSPGRKPTKLIGRKIGRLTVSEYIGLQNRQHTFKCICDCGNEIEVLERDIYLRKVMSCGCIKEGDYVIKKVEEWLIGHKINYKREFTTTNTSLSKNIRFDIVISGRIIGVIDCESPRFYEDADTARRNHDIDGLIQDIHDRKETFCMENNVGYLFVEFKDIERLDEVLGLYLKMLGGPNGRYNRRSSKD